MSTSIVELEISGAVRIAVTDRELTAVLSDGRTISVPLVWHPRLAHATQRERDNWELHLEGQHVHWPDLDEDISVESMLAGKPSGESQKSFKKWMEAKRAGRSLAYYDLAGDEKERQQDAE